MQELIQKLKERRAEIHSEVSRIDRAISALQGDGRGTWKRTAVVRSNKIQHHRVRKPMSMAVRKKLSKLAKERWARKHAEA